jgi:hypothetical protein
MPRLMLLIASLKRNGVCPAVRLVLRRLQANSNAIRKMKTGVAKTMTLLMPVFCLSVRFV